MGVLLFVSSDDPRSLLPGRKTRTPLGAWLWSCNPFRGLERGGAGVLKKVLVVDDSPAEIRLLQSVLQQGGFHSVAISDPTKIEEAIDEERPNVILLDVVMPQRNGF